jgi:hypothetical protein
MPRIGKECATGTEMLLDGVPFRCIQLMRDNEYAATRQSLPHRQIHGAPEVPPLQKLFPVRIAVLFPQGCSHQSLLQIGEILLLKTLKITSSPMNRTAAALVAATECCSGQSSQPSAPEAQPAIRAAWTFMPGRALSSCLPRHQEDRCQLANDGADRCPDYPEERREEDHRHYQHKGSANEHATVQSFEASGKERSAGDGVDERKSDIQEKDTERRSGATIRRTIHKMYRPWAQKDSYKSNRDHPGSHHLRDDRQHPPELCRAVSWILVNAGRRSALSTIGNQQKEDKPMAL